MNKRTLLVVMFAVVLALAASAFARDVYRMWSKAGPRVACRTLGGVAPTITGLSYTASAATANLEIYTGDNTITQTTRGYNAAATTIRVADETGIDVNDWVVLLDTDSEDFGQVSAIVTTTNLLTITGLNDRFSTETMVYEMQRAVFVTDVGTTKQDFFTEMFTGKKGWPIGVRLTQGTIHLVTTATSD